MAAVSLNFRQNPTKEQLICKLWEFRGEPQIRDLPSAPKQFLQYLREEDRPQITLDVDYENGMGISVGRLRPDRLFQ